MKFVIDNEEYLTQEEVEGKIGQKRSSIYYMVKFGNLPPPVKLNVKKLWKKSDIDEYLKNRDK